MGSFSTSEELWDPHLTLRELNTEEHATLQRARLFLATSLAATLEQVIDTEIFHFISASMACLSSWSIHVGV